MPLGLYNIQWLNQNSQRAYPIADWVSRWDQTATIQIPNSFIVALRIPIHAGQDALPERFYIKTLAITPTGYNIGIGYDDGIATPMLIAAINITRNLHTENLIYAVPGVGVNFDDTVGTICIGKLDEIDELPPGEYEFDYDNTTLETDAIFPQVRGISSIAIVTAGGVVTERIVGDIELVAGDNIRLTASISPGFRSYITIDAIDGEGLNETCVCETQLVEEQCITAINGIPPLPDGNFRIIGDNCLTVTPITHGIQIVDQCSEPCCGCAELLALTSQVDRFADGVVTLQGFVNRLASEVSSMSQVVIGSRLGDHGCVEC